MPQGRGALLLAFLVGLVVATAGTATAAKLITGKQIKDGSVAEKDLSKAVRAKLGRVAAAGPQGGQGVAGAQGPAGPAGPAAQLAPGSVGPAQLATVPAVRATRPVDQSVTTGTVTGLRCTAEDFDTAGLHDTVVNTDRLVAPVAGVYQVEAGVLWDVPDAGLHILALSKGDADTLVAQSVITTPEYADTVTALVKLQAGEYVRPIVYHAAGGSDIVDAGPGTYCAMHWVTAG